MDATIYESILKELFADSDANGVRIGELETQLDTERNKKNEIDSAIKVIQSKLDALLKTTDYEQQMARDSQNDTSLQNTQVTLNDGSEQVLKDAGKALHVDEIVEGLFKKFGRTTTKRSLNSTLMQDSKRRFRLLGKNYFDLASRAPITPNDLVTLFSYADTKQETDFSLIEATKAEIKRLSGREFNVNEIYDALHNKYPNEVSEPRRRSVSSTINNLRLQGFVEKIRAGSFDKPAIYKEIYNG